LSERQPDLGQQRQRPGHRLDRGEHEDHHVDHLHRRAGVVEVLRQDEDRGAQQGVEHGVGDGQPAVEAARGDDLLELGLLRGRLQMVLLQRLAASTVQLDLLEAVEQVAQQLEKAPLRRHGVDQRAAAVALAEIVEIDPGTEQHDDHGERQQRQRRDVDRRQQQRHQRGH